MDKATITIMVIGFPVAVVVGYYLSRFFADKRLKHAEVRVKELTETAKRDAENRKKEAELAARDLLIKMRQDFEKETKDRREEILSSERRNAQKEENIERRADLLEKKEKDIN